MRLAECRAYVSCLSFPYVSDQCPLPEDAPKGSAVGAGQD